MLREHGDLPGAVAAHRLAAESGHPYYGPEGAYEECLVLRDAGDIAGATAAFQRVIDSGEPMLAGSRNHLVGIAGDA
jgi:hypothetical protein